MGTHALRRLVAAGATAVLLAVCQPAIGLSEEPTASDPLTNDPASAPPTASGDLRAHLAHAEEVIPFDADFQGTTSAIAWRSMDDGRSATLYLSRSEDVRLGDFTTRDVADDVLDQSVSICGQDVVVGYLQRAPGDHLRLGLTRLPALPGTGSSVEIQAPVSKRGSLDLACTSDRAYLAWTDKVDGKWQAHISAVSLPGLERSETLDAGPAKRQGIAVAAVGEQALIVRQDRARIRLVRFHLDPKGEKLDTLSTRTIAKRGTDPIVDAHGSRVAVGYDRGKRSYILLSRDGGTSFGRRARFDRPVSGGPRGIDSLAIRRSDIVATMVVYRGGDYWERHRLRSDDWGTTWRRSRVRRPIAAIPIDGFLTARDRVKVAEAYTDGIYADKHDLRVRREE